MSYSRCKFFLFWENHSPFLPFLGVQGCLPVAHCHCGPGSGSPTSQRVLDALRCILSLIWALNELFQMKVPSVLRKSFTFFTLSWCARLSACGILPLRPGGLGAAEGPQKPEGSRSSETNSQPYLSPEGIIPDENSSCFEKTIYLFTFFRCAGLTVAHCHCGRGSGGRWRPPEARGF